MDNSTDQHEQHDPALQQQAWVWLRLLHSNRAVQLDLDGFERWVRTSAAHRQAFSQARRQWQTVGEAGALYAAQARLQTATAQPARPGRRRLLKLAAAGTTAAVAGAAVIRPPFGWWPAAETWSGDATAVGEQRTISMEDEVRITLNTQTSIRRQSLDGRTVGIKLIKGEAAIDLAGASRAFTVFAGVARSVAVGGNFEVRVLEDRICVSCLSGALVVTHPAGERKLAARQQTVYDAGRISGVGSIDPETVSAWRHGQLRFDKTPLRAVIAEINRYRPGQVMLLNDALRESPVSGSFYIASLDLALAQLQRTFNLQAKVLPAGIYLLS